MLVYSGLCLLVLGTKPWEPIRRLSPHWLVSLATKMPRASFVGTLSARMGP